jgi:hypothetical protein
MNVDAMAGACRRPDQHLSGGGLKEPLRRGGDYVL